MVQGQSKSEPDPGDENNIDDDENGYKDDLIGWNAALCVDSTDVCATVGDNYPYSATADHGINVAGVISARTNNNLGVAGVAGGWGSNPGAAFVPLNTLTGGGELQQHGTTWARALKYAVADTLDVVNMIVGFWDDHSFLEDADALETG